MENMKNFGKETGNTREAADGKLLGDDEMQDASGGIYNKYKQYKELQKQSARIYESLSDQD